MKFKYFFLGVIFSLFSFAIAFTSFYLGKKSIIKDVQTTTSDETIPSFALLPTQKPIDPQKVKELIVFSIANKNFDVFEEFIANPVNFRIENSDCCQPQTPAQAVVQLEYLNSSDGSWDFDQDNDIVKSLAASYPEHYSGAFIGISSDFYSASFQFAEDGKITKISISSSYQLLLE